MSLVQEKRWLDGDSIALVELDKYAFLKEVTLESPRTVCVLSVDVEAGAEAADPGNCRFLGKSALNLLFHAFSNHIDLLNQVVLADHIVNDLELEESQLVTAERDGVRFAVGGGVETVSLGTLAENQVVSIAFETPEAPASGTTASFGGINNQSGFAFMSQVSEL